VGRSHAPDELAEVLGVHPEATEVNGEPTGDSHEELSATAKRSGVRLAEEPHTLRLIGLL
jgi:hypothetical protein